MSETKIHKPTFTADSELTVFECDRYEVEENKDSTIHLRDPEDDDFELDDDDADFQKEMPGKRTGNLQRSFIVMSQYQSTLEGLQARRQQSDSEGNEDFEADNGSEGSYVYVERYIDSGLRPLKSDESRLYLDAINYRSKRRVHTSSESDEVQPLLDEIPSNIFQPWKKSKKKKKSETDDVVKKPSSVMSRGDFTSTEEETKSTASEPTDIDTGPLKKLQEFEDVTYTIKTDEPEEKPMEDFCVHTRDVPEGELADFSSTTFDEPARPREKKKKSIFRFLKKDDFCVHTHDAPESDSYSPDSRLSIITKKQEKPLLQSPRSRKTEKPLLESPRSRKTAPEGGGVVDDEVQSSRTPDASRLTLLTHKERRSKIFTQKSDEDDDLRSITTFRYPQYPSGTLVDLKEASRESLKDFESEDPQVHVDDDDDVLAQELPHDALQPQRETQQDELNQIESHPGSVALQHQRAPVEEVCRQERFSGGGGQVPDETGEQQGEEALQDEGLLRHQRLHSHRLLVEIHFCSEILIFHHLELSISRVTNNKRVIR
jgi:hypothetical protein